MTTHVRQVVVEPADTILIDEPGDVATRLPVGVPLRERLLDLEHRVVRDSLYRSESLELVGAHPLQHGNKIQSVYCGVKPWLLRGRFKSRRSSFCTVSFEAKDIDELDTACSTPRVAHKRLTATPIGDVVVTSLGEGPLVVLFAHGFPDDGAVFGSVREGLAHTYRVVGFDWPGCGESPEPAARGWARLPELASCLSSLARSLRREGASSVHLVGHDWGSVAGWEAIARPEAPSLFSSFTTLSGPPWGTTFAALRARLARRHGAGAALEQLRRSWYIAAALLPRGPDLLLAGTDRLAARSQRRIARLGGIPETALAPLATYRRNAKRGLDFYRQNPPGSGRALRHGHVSVPVHCVLATRDRFIATTTVEDALQAAARLRVTQLDANHWAPLSHPREVESAIRETLRWARTFENTGS